MLRFGIVGGGNIAGVHRIAAEFDSLASLCAGAFSRDVHKNEMVGRQWHIEDDRLYSSYEEMAQREKLRADAIDFCIVATPNSSHFEICKLFLENGFNVVCDKPMTTSLEDAKELVRLAQEKDLLFCVTYTYAYFPMVQLAKEMISQGRIGNIMMVMSEYSHESRLKGLMNGTAKATVWRLNPEISGPAGTLADLGTHVEYLVSMVTGLKITRLVAKLDKVPNAPLLDTNASMMVAYDNGASGVYWVSQVAAGSQNDIGFRIYGDLGTIEWHFSKGDELRITMAGEPVEVIRRFNTQCDIFNRYARARSMPLEPSHEAFANIYLDYCRALMDKRNHKMNNYQYPDMVAGLQGVRFIEACLRSSEENRWIEMDLL